MSDDPDNENPPASSLQPPSRAELEEIHSYLR